MAALSTNTCHPPSSRGALNSFDAKALPRHSRRSRVYLVQSERDVIRTSTSSDAWTRAADLTRPPTAVVADPPLTASEDEPPAGP